MVIIYEIFDDIHEKMDSFFEFFVKNWPRRYVC